MVTGQIYYPPWIKCQNYSLEIHRWLKHSSCSQRAESLALESKQQMLFTVVSALSRAFQEPRERTFFTACSAKRSHVLFIFFSIVNSFLAIKFGNYDKEDSHHQPVLTLLALYFYYLIFLSISVFLLCWDPFSVLNF